MMDFTGEPLNSLTEYNVETGMQYQKISSWTYMRSMSKLKKKDIDVDTDFITVYVDEMNKSTFVIKDKVLSELLYRGIKSEKASNNMPQVLSLLNFMAVEKKEKVVFITSDRDFDATYNSKQKPYALTIFYDLIKWFCDTFSTPENRIYVNVNKFMKCLLRHSNSIFMSLLLSISFEPYELTQLEMDEIVNELLYYCVNSYSCLTKEELQEEIINSSKAVYPFIKNGAYVHRNDDYGFNKLPIYLYTNIFKYTINPNTFNNLYDIFDSSKVDFAEQKLESEDFVFDEKLLETSAKEILENEFFTKYVINKNFGDETPYWYLKLKSPQDLDIINEVIDVLVNNGLMMAPYYVLPSLESDNIYIRYYVQQTDDEYMTITDYVDKIGHDQYSLVKLIYLINDKFIDNTDLRRLIFVDKSIDILSQFNINEYYEAININDAFNINYKKTEENIAFNHSLIILEVIKRFLENNKVAVDDIYNSVFMRMFSPAFALDIVNYIKDGSYNPSGMVTKLKDVFKYEYIDHIVFDEDINLDDQELLSRITFFDRQELPEGGRKIFNAQCETPFVFNKKNFKEAYYIESINNNSLTEFPLTKPNIDKIMYNFKLGIKKNLLMPEKVMISKDKVYANKYQVIGIVWTHSRVYKFSELIKNGSINTPQIYKVMDELIKLYDQYNYRLSSRTGGIDELLVDDNLTPIFNCNLIDNSQALYSTGRKNRKNYFNYLRDAIALTYMMHLNNFTDFEYEELYSTGEPIDLRFCKEHNEWHKRGDLCSKCKKVYHIRDNTKSNELPGVLHDFGTSVFREFYEGVLNIPEYTVDYKCVKIGLENRLYDKITEFLKPTHIYFERFSDYKRRKANGIVYTDFDFDSILPINTFKMMQRLKVILLLYKQILPLIFSGDFMVSSDKIFKTMFMDKNIKGKIIIPDIILLKCDDILSYKNSPSLDKVNATLNIFNNFLEEYILSDETLAEEYKNGNEHICKALESIKKYEYSVEGIREYIKTKDSFCRVHGIHYSSNEGICPKCIEDGITWDSVMLLKNSYFKKLESESPKYEGGEANLYHHLDNNDEIIKIFKDDAVDITFKSKIIGKVLQKSKLFEKFNAEHDGIKFVQIKNILYSYENNILNLEGYEEEYIEGSFKISALKDKNFVSELGYTQKDILEILIKACIGIEFLHSIGGYIGDLNGGNIVIKDKVVYFIDYDGMSFDDAKNFVYTHLYIYPPSVENKNITADDDWYSFAVQAFYYLTYSHPFRGISNQKEVPVNEVERMKLGYSILGNHGIKKPKISIGWDFMPDDMITYFINTFEGDLRESMLPILQNLYNELGGSLTFKFEEIKRKRPVLASVSETAYVDGEYNFICNEKVVLKFDSGFGIKQYEGDIFVAFMDNKTLVYNEKTGSAINFGKKYTLEMCPVNNKIYYLSVSKTDIYVDEYDSKTSQISTHHITKPTNYPIIDFSVNAENKFVIAEYNRDNDTIDIYCNASKVYSINKTDSITVTGIKIISDGIGKRWLVKYLDGDVTKAIVIDKTQASLYEEIELPEKIESKIFFFGNSIYYFEQGKICYYNIDKKRLKKKECDVACVDSRIQKKASKLIINNSKSSYKYFKS